MIDKEDDQTLFQTEEDKKKLEKEILGDAFEDDSEFDTTLNNQ